MLNQVLESIAEKAEAFPVVKIQQQAIYNEEDQVTYDCPDDFVLEKVAIEGAPLPENELLFIGRTEASFTKADAEFISEARGDILMLVDEVKRLRKLVEQCQEGFEAVRRANHARGHAIADEMLNVIEEVKEWL